MSSPGRPSTSSIDIQSLDANLSRFRSQLDQWADQVVARTVAEKDNHLRVQGKLAEEIRALEREHQNLTEEAGRVRQRLLTEEEEEEGLRAALATLVEKQETLPRLISDVQARVNEHANRLHRKQANVDSMAAIQTDMERGLTKILATYSSRLGLSLTPKDGAIEIGFTQVSRENPDKMYSMNLLIGDDGVYSVQKVPAGMEGTMRSLVEELNERNDLSWFVVQIRKALVDNCPL